MNILYGIQCTGNGHLTRSLKVVCRLKKMGHNVDILFSGKNYNKNIKYNVKYRFEGFTLYNTAKGKIDYFKTLMSFKILKFLDDIHLDVTKYDKVISDFEPITAWACKIQNKICYGLSNQYALLNNNVPRKRRNFIGEFILKWMAPVTYKLGFHFQKYDDSIYMPIVNDDIINANYEDHGHYTIYLPSFSLIKIINELIKYKNIIFHVFHGDVSGTYRYDNCLIFPINRKIFLESFTTSNSVITNSGFQTTSEALYAGKKLMTIPLRGQYEQECNMVALREMGVFTGKLKDIGKFINSDKVIIDKWDDPIDEIIKVVLN